jgi:hypothetical protein
VASEGPNSPGSLSDNSGTGSSAWSDTGNAASSNNSYASASGLKTTVSSHYLVAEGFGFSLPSGATVDGIVVEIERYRESGGFAGGVVDNRVRIIRNGTIGSTDKASGSSWPTSDGTATYGSSSDLWGETWSHSDINASNFGVALSAKGTSSLNAGTGYVDHIKVTVHYTESGKSGWATAAAVAVTARAATYVEAGAGIAVAVARGWWSGRDHPGVAVATAVASGQRVVTYNRKAAAATSAVAVGSWRGSSSLEFRPSESVPLTLVSAGASTSLTMEAHDPSTP